MRHRGAGRRLDVAFRGAGLPAAAAHGSRRSLCPCAGPGAIADQGHSGAVFRAFVHFGKRQGALRRHNGGGWGSKFSDSLPAGRLGIYPTAR